MQLLRGVFQSPLLYGVRTMGAGHLGGRRLGVARRVEHEPRVPPERAGRSRSWRWRRPPERGTCSWIVARAPERRRAFFVRFLTKGAATLGFLDGTIAASKSAERLLEECMFVGKDQ